MNKKLKLCPFCGGHAMIFKEEYGYIVACNVCGNKTIWYYDKRNAVKVWNKRVDK